MNAQFRQSFAGSKMEIVDGVIAGFGSRIFSGAGKGGEKQKAESGKQKGAPDREIPNRARRRERQRRGLRRDGHERGVNGEGWDGNRRSKPGREGKLQK